MSGQGSRRLFFGLWPDAAAIQAMGQAADRLAPGGRRIAADKRHLTLAFVGHCSADEMQLCCRRADQLRLPSFDVVLDRADYFQRPRIVWLGPTRVPDALTRLAAALASPGLENRPFRPHVSLARGARPLAALAISPIAWNVRHFALIESGAQGQPGAYRTLQSWSLDASR